MTRTHRITRSSLEPKDPAAGDLAPDAILQDEFVTTSARVLEWIEENRQTVLTILAAALAVAMAIVVYRSYQRSQAEAHTLALFKGITKFQGNVVSADPKPDHPISPTFAKDADRLAAAAAAFPESSGHFGGLSPVATLYRGHVLLGQGKHAEAIAAYQAYLTAVAGNPDYQKFTFSAHENLGYAHEAKGDLKAAAENFAKLLDVPALRDLGLYHSGRMAALQGDKAKAKENFDKLVAEFPESALKPAAEERLLGLQ